MLPAPNQHDRSEDSQTMRAVFGAPVKLLEHNRPAHSPWMSPSFVEQEMAVQAFEEAAEFTDDMWMELSTGG